MTTTTTTKAPANPETGEITVDDIPGVSSDLDSFGQDQAIENIGFDPAQFLVRINKIGEYLPAWASFRWLRSEHPEASWESKVISVTEEFACVQAKITLIRNGQSIVAMGTSVEFKSAFPGGYIEKAETAAFRRAAAFLGYDTDEALKSTFEEGRVANTPIPTNRTPKEGYTSGPVYANPQTKTWSGQGGKPGGAATPGNGVTDKQLKAIFGIGRDTLGLSDGDIDARCDELFHCPPEQLSKYDASRFIDALKRDAGQ